MLKAFICDFYHVSFAELSRPVLSTKIINGFSQISRITKQYGISAVVHILNLFMPPKHISKMYFFTEDWQYLVYPYNWKQLLLDNYC